MKTDWNKHYKKDKSVLSYPDENLVRLVMKELQRFQAIEELKAIDVGCGSGRHIAFMQSAGLNQVYGTDNSFNALQICRDLDPEKLIHCDNRDIPLRNELFDISVAWGSLHYSTKPEIIPMISEIKRITKSGGVIFATLRTDKDTYLKTGKHLGNNTWQTGLNDLTGTIVSFYNEDELKTLFSGFSELNYGWMERTIIGDTSKVISHWVISARK
ncbi:MAG TPA: methyltransferase domain-containing protein [Spirochaetota bacterium]|nr:methyltransferase domain-containing protein [Spirochaetota bacterium]HPR36129.1 methyltransferase domain-containing protein [Spirochaetota bacterium]HRX47801.1 methyltransferase domain-containing protein [Spirochaetota bacterium]